MLRWLLPVPLRPASLLLAGTFVASGASAHAQAAGQPEIVVTGERTQRSLAETSSSVAVLSAGDVETLAGAERVEQVLALVPNVQLGSGGDGPTIRGIDSTGVLRDLPAFLGGNRPRVTLQVDGRPVTYSEFAFGVAPIWDVERIEVFRSPQTTTQGRNSIGGAIFIETHDPTFDWQGSGRLLAETDQTMQASALVSGPLIDDAFAIRIAADIRRGRTSSELTTTAAINPNRDDYESFKVKLLARPAAIPGLSVKGIYSHLGSQSPQIQGMRVPFREREDPRVIYGVFTTRVDSLTLLADYDIAPGAAVRTTLSLGDATIRRFAPRGFGEARIRADDTTAEAVLDWKVGSDLGLIAGANFTKVRQRQAIDLSAALLGAGAFTDRQESLGLFAELSARPLPRISLSMGARYQSDTQDRAGALSGNLRPLGLVYRGTFERFLPKFSFSYEPVKETRIGLVVQKAYNPGGVTINLRDGSADTFDAETLWAQELFVRSNLLDGALWVTANFFSYDMKDAQRAVADFIDTPGGTVFFSQFGNAPAARSRGGELELRWQPQGPFSLTAAAGLLSTRLRKSQIAMDPLTGKRFQRSPHFSGSLALGWRPFSVLQLHAQVRHHSSYYSDDVNTPELRISPATSVDFRADLKQGGIDVFAYVRNVFDAFNLTYIYSTRDLATAEVPREFGMGIQARF